jgi:diguanylate cyclase (GGDEF)-like protein/PAS domain S-box-containing protein
MSITLRTDGGAGRHPIDEGLSRQSVERQLLAAASEALASKAEELRQQRELFEVTLASIGDAVITTDARGRITYLNPIAEAMTGWSTADAAGKPMDRVLQIINDDTRQLVDNPIGVALQTGQVAKLPAQSTLIARNGASIPIGDSAAPIRDTLGNIVGAVVVLHDVSVARTTSLRISHQAHHDSLTDLPNRLLLLDRLSQAIAMAHRNRRQLAVLFLDLDRFKPVNDSLGHEIGDRVLRFVAQRLLRCVRSSDTVSRQGGDEFVILLAEIKHAQDAEICAQKMLSTLCTSSAIEEQDLYITASIGIAIYPDDGHGADALLKHADLAMYRAKESGGNAYRFFEAPMKPHNFERQCLESSLHRAFEQGEFVLHYERKVSLADDALAGVEALIRWMHPQRGLLLPGQFMPLAQETGLIVPLGQWALRAACRQLRVWRHAGLPVPRLAIAVSPVELRTKDFISSLCAIMAEEGCAPGELELELDADLLEPETAWVAAVLQSLRSLGVRLVLRNFGIGIPNLSHLMHLPIDVMRVDESLVHDLTTNPDGASILSALISMSSCLQLAVSAGGVQSAEQLEFLRQQGCREAQGDYFGGAVAASDLEALLEAEGPQARQESSGRG